MFKSAGEYFKWVTGRQSSESAGSYFKMLLLRFSKCEVNIIKVPQGTRIKPHVDYVPTLEHHRVNITLWRPKHGGHFYCDRRINNDSRVVYFRPDLNAHGLTRVHVGTLLMLSIGWVR